MLLLFGGLVSLWVFHDEAGPSGLLVPPNVFCPKGVKKTQILVVECWKSLYGVDPIMTQYYVEREKLVYHCEPNEHCNEPYRDGQYDLTK